ncbi:MAG: phosphate/phosphite/phosphonate ABC transporter substrate-binding protein [Zoogloeaceae bacterium]|jgi:ABC-type phosphate/phosphonate transport system substrate-binding protein|nr:phosphate/phosphite/phosphonate ABC transporter substrate-binding protein [Zoogloeaceae bacterium]
MRICSRLFVLLCTAFCFSQSFAAERLSLGLVPYSTAASLIKTHAPLRDYLNRTLDSTSTTFFVPSDYATFYKEALTGKFDVVSASAHFVPGLLRQGYVPLVQYGTRLKFTVIVHKDSPIQKAEDLRGKRLGLPGFLSMYYVYADEWLKRNDLYNAVYMIPLGAHETGMERIAEGQLDAMFATPQNLAQLPPELRSRLKSLDITKISFPSLAYLAHRNLGAKKIAQLKRLLEAFPTSAEGQVFFGKNTAYGGFKPLTPKDIEEVQPYGRLTDKLLGL